MEDCIAIMRFPAVAPKHAPSTNCCHTSWQLQP
jgi:hypothetical protein